MTAAHCFLSKTVEDEFESKEKFSIYLTKDTIEGEACSNEIDIENIKFLTNAARLRVTAEDDIAIVMLKNSLTFSPEVIDIYISHAIDPCLAHCLST